MGVSKSVARYFLKTILHLIPHISPSLTPVSSINFKVVFLLISSPSIFSSDDKKSLFVYIEKGSLYESFKIARISVNTLFNFFC